ncbi:MAG: DnaB-like helicase C-terminal domain-containing protein [Rhodomicrobium sp.]
MKPKEFNPGRGRNGKNGKRKEEAADGAVKLPHDPNSEIRVIGTVLKDNDAFDEVEFLEPQHFFDPMRCAVWTAIQARLRKGEKVSPVLIAATFPTADGDNATVLKACNEACTHAASRDLLKDYAKTVFALAENRQAHDIATLWAQKALDPSNRETLNGMRSAIDDAAEMQDIEGDQSEAWEAAANRAAELYRTRGETLTGVRTHIQGLDEIMPAMREGNMILLAGVPGHGKTTLANQIALNNAMNGIPVLFFTLEMSRDEIVQKLVSMLSGVPEDVIDHGDGNQEQMDAYFKAAAKLQKLPLRIIGKKPMKPGMMFSIARREARKFGIKLVVIDYLGKMTPDDRTNGVYERMSLLSNDVKNIAGQLCLPILTLAQLNREIFKRPNKKPQNSDLRDSGNLEADADVILFVQKTQGMLELEEPMPGSEDYASNFAVWQDRWRDAAGQTVVYLTKSRRTGKTGTVELKYKDGGLS